MKKKKKEKEKNKIIGAIIQIIWNGHIRASHPAK
jgi:hypothetical protein